MLALSITVLFSRWKATFRLSGIIVWTFCADYLFHLLRNHFCAEFSFIAFYPITLWLKEELFTGLNLPFPFNEMHISRSLAFVSHFFHPSLAHGAWKTNSTDDEEHLQVRDFSGLLILGLRNSRIAETASCRPLSSGSGAYERILFCAGKTHLLARK